MPMISVMATTGIENIFTNLQHAAANFGGRTIIFIGIILAVVGIIRIAIGLMNHGKRPCNWAMNIICIFVGLFMATAGYSGLKSAIGNTSEQTINALMTNNGISESDGAGTSTK